MGELWQQMLFEERNHTRIHFYHGDGLDFLFFRCHEGIVPKPQAVGDDFPMGCGDGLFHGFDFTHHHAHPHISLFQEYRKWDAAIEKSNIRIAEGVFCGKSFMVGLEEFAAQVVCCGECNGSGGRRRRLHMGVVGIFRHQRRIVKVGVRLDFLK